MPAVSVLIKVWPDLKVFRKVELATHKVTVDYVLAMAGVEQRFRLFRYSEDAKGTPILDPNVDSYMQPLFEVKDGDKFWAEPPIGSGG